MLGIARCLQILLDRLCPLLGLDAIVAIFQRHLHLPNLDSIMATVRRVSVPRHLLSLLVGRDPPFSEVSNYTTPGFCLRLLPSSWF